MPHMVHKPAQLFQISRGFDLTIFILKSHLEIVTECVYAYTKHTSEWLAKIQVVASPN